MQSLSILTTALRYTFLTQTWLYFCAFYLCSNFIIAMFFYGHVIMVEFLQLLIFIGARRSLCYYILQENNNSIYPFTSALGKGFETLYKAWWLTSLYYLLSVGELLLLSWSSEHITIGLALTLGFIAIKLLQFFADFLLYPIISDGIYQWHDVLKLLMIYYRKYFYPIFKILILFMTIFLLGMYSIASLLFFARINSFIFENISSAIFYSFLSITQTLFYLHVHYAHLRD